MSHRRVFICLPLCDDSSNILVLAVVREKGVGNVEEVLFYPNGVSRGNPKASPAIKQP